MTGPLELRRAFGSENRRRLLTDYFSYFPVDGGVTPENAFQHIYRLLLWADPTTGLAHCYESDKAQPGRPWYDRSLRFHAWLSQQLGTSPADLGGEIDWLFRRAARELARGLTEGRLRLAREQRAAYDGLGMPEPGEDPELEEIIREALRPWFREDPPADILARLTQRIHEHTRLENKRKNLVGEGFEDVLAGVVGRLHAPGIESMRARALLQEIPGFSSPAERAKAKKVDLVLLTRPDSHRVLITAKWSIRADREEQFGSDFQSYATLERSGQSFDYVLVTNEFDPARLAAACERQVLARPLFSEVVHVSTEALLATYGPNLDRSFRRVEQHVASGRLKSLGEWLGRLAKSST
ncbi:MAG TPA: hypothetical protein VNW71_12500 [Thermoanaerobaculia bacterium]|nr:hypothetical protein [Thermoanaerobaculia bacterium]